MATYAELSAIKTEASWPTFLDKVRLAAAVKAAAILDSATPSAAAVAWASAALSSPASAGDDVVWYVIAKNKGVALTAILGASDSAIQANVDAAVDIVGGV